MGASSAVRHLMARITYLSTNGCLLQYILHKHLKTGLHKLQPPSYLVTACALDRHKDILDQSKQTVPESSLNHGT